MRCGSVRPSRQYERSVRRLSRASVVRLCSASHCCLCAAFSACAVANLSASVALAPGDLIFTGTPAGVGALQRGDEVTATVAGLESVTFEMV